MKTLSELGLVEKVARTSSGCAGLAHATADAGGAERAEATGRSPQTAQRCTRLRLLLTQGQPPESPGSRSRKPEADPENREAHPENREIDSPKPIATTEFVELAFEVVKEVNSQK